MNIYVATAINPSPRRPQEPRTLLSEGKILHRITGVFFACNQKSLQDTQEYVCLCFLCICWESQEMSFKLDHLQLHICFPYGGAPNKIYSGSGFNLYLFSYSPSSSIILGLYCPLSPSVSQCSSSRLQYSKTILKT